MVSPNVELHRKKLPTARAEICIIALSSSSPSLP
jgi:hypothetical protein